MIFLRLLIKQALPSHFRIIIRLMVLNATFNNISALVSFIGGGNSSSRRKSPTCRKSLTNFVK